jgi:hypothetical protein
MWKRMLLMLFCVALAVAGAYRELPDWIACITQFPGYCPKRMVPLIVHVSDGPTV